MFLEERRRLKKSAVPKLHIDDPFLVSPRAIRHEERKKRSASSSAQKMKKKKPKSAIGHEERKKTSASAQKMKKKKPKRKQKQKQQKTSQQSPSTSTSALPCDDNEVMPVSTTETKQKPEQQTNSQQSPSTSTSALPCGDNEEMSVSTTETKQKPEQQTNSQQSPSTSTSALPCGDNEEMSFSTTETKQKPEQLTNSQQPPSTSTSASPCNDTDIMFFSTTEVEIECDQDACNSAQEPQTTSSPPPTSSKSTQCKSSKRMISIFDFVRKPKCVAYYTSFETFAHFMFFFNILGPATHHLGVTNILPPEDQLLLTLIKIRQAKDDFELHMFFDIAQPLVSKIFTTWINFLFFQLSELPIWPDRSVIDDFMPSDFKSMFPATRVILDATEIPIQKPKATGPQRETYSSYKNKNTLKVLVGCTPRGSVSYVSDAYGGSASDRQIIERSELCTQNGHFSPKDSIMADRGILVQDLFISKDVHVNTPTMLKGKSQLEPHEVNKDRKIASKRIHVERVIGLAKTYKILKKDLNSCYTTLGNRIIHVCFYLCNFRDSIVKKSA